MWLYDVIIPGVRGHRRPPVHSFGRQISASFEEKFLRVLFVFGGFECDSSGGKWNAVQRDQGRTMVG